MPRLGGIPGTDNDKTGDPHEKRNLRLSGKQQPAGSRHHRAKGNFPPGHLEAKNKHQGKGKREHAGQCPFRRREELPDARCITGRSPVGEHQHRDHGGEIQHIVPQRPRGLGIGQMHLGIGFGLLLFSEQNMHHQADHDAEQYRADRPGDAQLRPEHTGRQNDGQHIDRRAGIQKRGCRTDARAHFVDSAEERQHRAGAHGQHRAGNRRHAVGQHLVRPRTKVFHHRRLTDKHGDGTGDEERRHQAQQHMFAGVPARQGQGFDHCGIEPPGSHRQPVDHAEHTEQQRQ